MKAPSFPPFLSWQQWRLLAAISSLCVATAGAETIVVINEVDADQTGTDAAEFVELYAYDSVTNAAVAGADLSAYTLVLFNGNGKRPYAKYALTGKMTSASGFYVLGNTGVPGADAAMLLPANGLQNGGSSNEGDAVALCTGDASVIVTGASGTYVADLAALGITVADALVYDGGTEANGDDFELLEGLGLGGQSIVHDPPAQSAARQPDGGAPLRQGLFAASDPTPGASNSPVNALFLTLSPPSLAEGATATAVLSRTGAAAAEITVSLSSSDASEASVPATVVIPAGQASANVLITGVDDLWNDGSQPVTISAAAPDYISATLEITVTDNGDSDQPVLFNEVYVTGRLDANGDGEENGSGFASQINYNDEFVELVNRSAAAVDLSGYALHEATLAEPRHVFPAGTVLAPGAAVIVFGGGAPAWGITAGFGTAWVQVANAPVNGLFLLDGGNRLSLRNPGGQEVAGFSYGSEIVAPGSPPVLQMDALTRDPDLTGNFKRHFETADGLDHTPGFRTDGETPFATLTAQLSASLSAASVAENAGAAATVLTVTRPSASADPLVVAVRSSDATEAVPAAETVTIPAGAASATLAINAVDDAAVDGSQAVPLICVAAGHFNAVAELTVTDDGHDLPAEALFINEIDSDQPGDETGEFIELYTGSPGVKSLSGLIVVLFNGNHSADGAYRVFDLDGQVTTAGGFFVIGGAAVQNVNMAVAGTGWLQNGADAVAVYRTAAANFLTGQNDATPPTTQDLIDAVVYGNGSAEDSGLLSLLSTGEPLLAQQNEGAANNTTALARVPDAASAFGSFIAQAPTPGTSNALVPATGYDQWAANPAYAGIGGRTDDFDDDGLANIAEYATDSDPTKAAIPYTLSLNASGKLRLSIPKGSIAAADPKLACRVTASATLAEGSWSTTGTTVITDSAAELVVDYTGEAPAAFLRLEVVLQP